MVQRFNARNCRAGQAEQFQILPLKKDLGLPTVLFRRDFEVAQDLLDVDGIAEIPANIFAEALHGKIFIQMAQRANNFRKEIEQGETGS